MMAETGTNSESEKLYLIGGLPNKWSEVLDRPFTKTDGGDTYKYVFTADVTNNFPNTSNDYYFRVKTASQEYYPETNDAPVGTTFTSAKEGFNSNKAWKLSMTKGKSYTLIFDLKNKQIKYSEGGSEGGSTSPSKKGIELFNGSSPLTGSNGKYTLDLMRSTADDATISLKIDGVTYGLATAQTIDAVGTTNVDFTKGKTEVLTLKQGLIYSLTVTEDGKMTVVAKKGVADGNYYLVGNFFEEDGGKINYEKKYFRFTNSKGDGTLTLDIPASLTIKAKVYTSDGKCYGPANGGPEYGISNTNPKADVKSVYGNLAAGDNFWTFNDRGLNEIGIYTITITVDKDGIPTAWNVAYDKSKRMAYFLVDPTEDPDAVVYPTYAVVKDDRSCDSKFFGQIYLEANRHCFVVGNITKDNDNDITGHPLKTTKKLYLQGNGGFDPTEDVDGEEKAKRTKVYPNRKKGFIYKETKSMVLEYNPSAGYDGVAGEDGNNRIGGEVKNAQSKNANVAIKSVHIVGNGVVDSWNLNDAKEMSYNNKLNCWECTIKTTKSESKDNKFRFVANKDWKYNWGEESTKSEDQARTPYTDKSKLGHEASLEDPNELGFTTNGAKDKRDDNVNTFGDMIFNRPAGVWIIRLFTRTEDDATGNDYVVRHACTITESKEIYLTYCKDKFIRTYSNNKPMNPVNDNVKIYEVYKYENTGGGNAENIYAKGTVYLRQLKYVPANVGVVLIGEAPADTYKDGDQLVFSLSERTEASVKEGGDYREVWTNYEYYKAKGEKWNNYLVPTVEAKNNLGNAEVENGEITYRYFGLHNYYSTKSHQSLGKDDTQPDYIGFFRFTADGMSGANKAYLSIPANKEVGNGVGAKYGYIDYNGQLLGNDYDDESKMPSRYAKMALVFDDMVGGNETTDIKELETEKMNNNKYYNLQGIEVAHPVKGIYIHNGKKVIVK